MDAASSQSTVTVNADGWNPAIVIAGPLNRPAWEPGELERGRKVHPEGCSPIPILTKAAKPAEDEQLKKGNSIPYRRCFSDSSVNLHFSASGARDLCKGFDDARMLMARIMPWPDKLHVHSYNVSTNNDEKPNRRCQLRNLEIHVPIFLFQSKMIHCDCKGANDQRPMIRSIPKHSTHSTPVPWE